MPMGNPSSVAALPALHSKNLSHLLPQRRQLTNQNVSIDVTFALLIGTSHFYPFVFHKLFSKILKKHHRPFIRQREEDIAVISLFATMFCDSMSCHSKFANKIFAQELVSKPPVFSLQKNPPSCSYQRNGGCHRQLHSPLLPSKRAPFCRIKNNTQFVVHQLLHRKNYNWVQRKQFSGWMIKTFGPMLKKW